MPGPGGYLNDSSTFKAKGNAGFGSKYKSETSLTPGPGQYNNAISLKKATAGAARIGTASRPELWHQKGKEDAPGPADFGENFSSFKAKGGAVIGGKHKERVSETPGPGAYQAEAAGSKGTFQGTFTH